METFERARLKLEVDRLPKLLTRTSVLRLAAGRQIKDVVRAPQKNAHVPAHRQPIDQDRAFTPEASIPAEVKIIATTKQAK